MYNSINLLRTLAANLVIVLHFCMKYQETSLITPLVSFSHTFSLGVDIFFVISGFVIHQSITRKKEFRLNRFLISRFRRIAPLYYFYTLLYLLLSIVGLSNSYVFDIEHFIMSMLFMPSASFSGLYAPILYVGWTLSYEFYFYFIYGVYKKLFDSSIFLFGVVVVAIPIVTFHLIFDVHYFLQTRDIIFSPLVLEFFYGILLSKLIIKFKHKLIFIRFPLFLLSVLSIVLISESKFDDYWRFFYYGIPAAFLVCSFILYEENALFKLKLIGLMGKASYSLYLSHIFVLAFIFVFFDYFDYLNFWFLLIISLILCNLGSFYSYLYIESKLIPIVLFKFNNIIPLIKKN